MKNLHIAVLIVVVIIASGLSGYAISNSERVIVTQYTTSTIQISQTAQMLSSSGYITIVNGSVSKTFYYLEWNSSTPAVFTIFNVKFSSWSNATITDTAGSCYATNGTVVTSSHSLMVLLRA